MQTMWYPSPELEQFSLRRFEQVYRTRLQRNLPLPKWEHAALAVQAEIARIYRVLLCLCFSPERADSMLRTLRWEYIRISDDLHVQLDLEPYHPDLVDAIMYHPLEISEQGFRLEQCEQVMIHIRRAIPSIRDHVHATGDRHEMSVYCSTYIYRWYLHIGGNPNSNAKVSFSQDWLLSHFVRLALSKSDVLPSPQTFQYLRGGLDNLIARIGLVPTIRRIESASHPVQSPLDLD